MNRSLDLRADDWFTITGRGRVACVYLPEGDDVNVGDRVRIDGDLYDIRGIECVRKANGVLMRNFGLIVRAVG